MQRFVSSMVGAVATGLLLTSAQAGAATITFDELDPFVSPGDTLSNQYAALLGVTFVAFGGNDPDFGSWTTDMTIVDSTVPKPDTGGLGGPPSGNILRSESGWLGEYGDPSFSINFSSSVSFVSALFVGVDGDDSPNDVRMLAYDEFNKLVDTAVGTTSGQFTLTLNAPSIRQVFVVPGSLTDWVGVDNITFTPVPLPAAAWLLLSGLGGLGVLARRRKA